MPRRRGPESRSAEEAMRTMAAPTRSRAGCKNVGETLGKAPSGAGGVSLAGSEGWGAAAHAPSHLDQGLQPAAGELLLPPLQSGQQRLHHGVQHGLHGPPLRLVQRQQQ